MSRIPEDIKKIDERIAAMRNKKQADDKNAGISDAAMAFQIVSELAAGILVGAGIGYILDELFDFRVICLLIFTIFGAMAGLLNVVRSLKIRDEQNKEE